MFRETYRSTESITKENLPDRFSGDRNFSTAIYFLLNADEFSAFHRLKQDEIWHFYDGSALTIHIIDEKGEYFELVLGKETMEKESLQIAVNGGWLFGASVKKGGSFSLVGCTVAPGFDFDDFEMPSRNELLLKYPHYEKVIRGLTQKLTGLK